MARKSSGLDKEAERNWNSRQVVDGEYQISTVNPLHKADYAYALRNGSGTVAEILYWLGRKNLKKLQTGKVSKSRVASESDMPLIIVTENTWTITQSGISRYTPSWRKLGIAPPIVPGGN